MNPTKDCEALPNSLHSIVLHNGKYLTIKFQDFMQIMDQFRADKPLDLDEMYTDISNYKTASSLLLVIDEYQRPYSGFYLVHLPDENCGELHAFFKKKAFRHLNGKAMKLVSDLLTNNWNYPTSIRARFDEKSNGAKRILRSITLHKFDSLNEVDPDLVTLTIDDLNFREWDATFESFYQHPQQAFRIWSTLHPYTLPL